jgi:hypothetical protein
LCRSPTTSLRCMRCCRRGWCSFPAPPEEGPQVLERQQAKLVMRLYHVDDLMAGVAARRRVRTLNASGAVATTRLRGA